MHIENVSESKYRWRRFTEPVERGLRLILRSAGEPVAESIRYRRSYFDNTRERSDA